MDGRNLITILTLDGGGVRGIIPATILSFLESQLQDLDGEDARIADYFDVIAGTNTGGLVAAMLSTADENGRPLYAAKEIVSFFIKNCPKIFPQTRGPFSSMVKVVKHLIGPKYNGKKLRNLMAKTFGLARISDTLTDVVIPTFDIKLLQPAVFSTSESKKMVITLCQPKGYVTMRNGTMKNKYYRIPLAIRSRSDIEGRIDISKDALLSDICIGTLATPTYLPPHYFETQDYLGSLRSFNLVDGGVAANNPALLAIGHVTLEVSKKNPDFYPVKPMDYGKFLIISLGSGAMKKVQKYHANKAAKWGILGWLGHNNGGIPMFDSFTHASARLVDFHISVLLRALGSKSNYLRIQEDKLTRKAASLDNATTNNLENLTRISEGLLQKPFKLGGTNKQALVRFAKLLSQERRLRQEKNHIRIESNK